MTGRNDLANGRILAGDHIGNRIGLLRKVEPDERNRRRVRDALSAPRSATALEANLEKTLGLSNRVGVDGKNAVV